MRGSLLIAVALLLCPPTQAQNADRPPERRPPTTLVAQGAPPDLTPTSGPAPGQQYVLVTTTPSLDGYRMREYKGLVRGVMVRQPTIGQGLAAGLERVVGGKVGAYLEMCNTGRQQAYDLCVERARALGANAVIGMAYDSTAFEHGDDLEVEIVCYGTAVVLERIPPSP